jgi:hypothetical protein
MTKLIYTLSIILFTTGNITHAQTTADQQRYKEAQTALNEKKCDVAFNALSRVSIDGKDQPEYFRLMGEMHECKGNKEQAVFFYEKYQAAHPNDTTQLKINYLQTVVEKKQRVETKEKLKTQISAPYTLWGINEAIFLNTRNSPYKHCVELSLVRGFPLFNNRAGLECNLSAGMLAKPNFDWVIRATGSEADSQFVKRIDGGYTANIGVALMPYFYKTKKITVAAGPEAAFWIGQTGSHSYLYSGVVNESNLGWLTLKYGVKARVYYTHKVSFFIAYEKLAINNLDVHYEPPAVDKKVSFGSGMLAIGLSVFTHFEDE